MVVDKNDEDGNYTRTADAKLFVNEEPIARTLTCKCGGGQEVHHNNMVVVKMNEKQTEEMITDKDGKPIVIDFYNQRKIDGDTVGTITTGSATTGSGTFCVAMRGRNPERPTDRTPGLHTEQRLEPNKDGLVNTLTTVQKDNLVRVRDCEEIEIKQATKEGSIKCKVGGCYDASYPDSTTRRGRVQNNGDVTPTLTAGSSENINVVETRYRIRKLTPKECWRLMGYTDTDFEKAKASGVSNSQLYKQAGNAIVKQVLMAIFSQMGIKGVKAWND